ncbi:MAG: hypothetical protein ACKO0Z_06865 [Betaproteobacteria bacterium]
MILKIKAALILLALYQGFVLVAGLMLIPFNLLLRVLRYKLGM